MSFEIIIKTFLPAIFIVSIIFYLVFWRKSTKSELNLKKGDDTLGRNIIRKIGYTVLFIVSIFVVAFIKDFISISIHNYNYEKDKDNIMNKVSDSINDTLPKKIDAMTEVFTTYYVNDKFVYKYRLDIYKSDIENSQIDSLSKNIKTNLLSSQCTENYKDRVFYKYTIRILHKYYDKEMKHLMSIPFSYSECE